MSDDYLGVYNGILWDYDVAGSKMDKYLYWNDYFGG